MMLADIYGNQDDEPSSPVGVVEPPDLDQVPAELRALPQWVLWRSIVRDDRPTKIPVRADGSAAKANDPSTWTTFEAAMEVFREAPPGRFSGLGFVFADSDPYVGIDFDGCLDGGEIADWAKSWLDRFKGCYTEVSPSGKGLKIWARGKLAGSGGKREIGGRKHTGIEIYDQRHFFTVTADVLGRPEAAIPERQDVVDELYRWVKERPSSPVTPSPVKVKAAPGVEWTAERRAVEYLAKVDPAVSGRNGHGKTLWAAMIGPGFDLAPDVAYQLLADHWNARCDPPWGEKDLRRKVEEAYRVEARRGWLLTPQQPQGRPSGGGAMAVALAEAPIQADPGLDARLATFPKTELGNAERLVARFGADVRYCPPWKSWLVWDGRRFALDETGAIDRRVERAVRSMLHEAATIDDLDDRKALGAWQRASESRSRIESTAKLASHLEGVSVMHGEMDRDGWLFNCPNGTIDLRIGEIRPHDRADLITKLCPVAFDPYATCPLWESTLDLFFAGDRALIAYWQRLCGYFLVGLVREHILPIAYGTGANGKSTILGTLLGVMGGDYAIKAPPSMLVVQKHEPHPTALADLHGKRLVVAIETEEGQALNESLIKELTGGDVIRARRLYQDHWQFLPTHTVVLATNHKPVIRGQDKGIWRRAKMIPFGVSLPPDKWDTTVKERLLAEYPGILAWCVRGCLSWQEVGLNEPDVIRRATAEYQAEQDVMGSFLAAVTVQGPNYRVKAGTLYEAYKSWAESSGERSMNLRAFGEAMRERGFESRKNSVVWYLGVGLPDGGFSTSEE